MFDPVVTSGAKTDQIPILIAGPILTHGHDMMDLEPVLGAFASLDNSIGLLALDAAVPVTLPDALALLGRNPLFVITPPALEIWVVGQGTPNVGVSLTAESAPAALKDTLSRLERPAAE